MIMKISRSWTLGQSVDLEYQKSLIFHELQASGGDLVTCTGLSSDVLWLEQDTNVATLFGN